MPSSGSPEPSSQSDKHALLDEKIYPKSRFKIRFSWWPVLGAICFVALLFNMAAFERNRRVNEPAHITYTDRASWLYRQDGIEKFHKPAEFKIVAIVLYNHKDRGLIVDCYLKRNLVSSGGFLDGVIFLSRTHNMEDVTWLNTIVTHTPGYIIANSTGTNDQRAWDICEPGIMYIKIDDTIVLFEDSTIPSLVRTKITHPHSLLVSANAVNHPSVAWIHHHLDVVRPYLPELNAIKSPNSMPHYDWRASALPPWEGPEDYTVPDNFRPPFKQHRWLPALSRPNTDGMPVSTLTYSQEGQSWQSWTSGAQQHYSFLEHLENGELWRYKFPVWDYHYARVSLSFVCVWGDDIIAVRDQMTGDEEGYLSVDAPRKLGRHVILDGSGLAVQYSFEGQKAGIDNTDLLDRYRAYAEENICVK